MSESDGTDQSEESLSSDAYESYSSSSSESVDSEDKPLSKRASKGTNHVYKVNRKKGRMAAFTEADLRKPERIQRMWEIAHNQMTDLQRKVRAAQQKNRRLQGQVVRLKNLVKHLKSVHR